MCQQINGFFDKHVRLFTALHVLKPWIARSTLLRSGIVLVWLMRVMVYELKSSIVDNIYIELGIVVIGVYYQHRWACC